MTLQSLDVEITIPEACDVLLEDHSYIGLHGGRGSAKSHSVAAFLIDEAAASKQLVLCGREIQSSMRDSVKKLLDFKIDQGGYRPLFESTDTEIRGRQSKTLIIFKGLRSTPESVKSTEGVTRCWLEEANRVSQNSLDLVLPTVMREAGSRLIASWNPEKPDDPVDAMFRGNDPLMKEKGIPFVPLPGSAVREVNFEDNPFFPQGLESQMLWDKSRDIDKYNHVWRGKYKANSESRVFKNWVVREFDYPPGDTIFHYGADWGFSIDPSVLVRCFIDEEARKLYICDEAYAVGCEIDFLPKLFAGRAGATPEEQKVWTFLDDAAWPGVPDARRWEIRADSARPETISYMQRRGFNIQPAKKGPGSIEDGIEFLQNYDIVVHPRCKHTIDELSFYSFKTDPLTGKILPILADKNNHVIDALRYAVEGIATGMASVWARLGKQARGKK